MSPTDELIDRIIALGPTDKDRAKTLGVSMRTITGYKTGKIPRIIVSLLDRGIIRVSPVITKTQSYENDSNQAA